MDDVRAAARAVLLLDHEGDTDEALKQAHVLAAEHPKSAIAQRLVGDLRYAAAIRAAAGDGSEKEREAEAAVHLRAARHALLATRRLAPDCVDVAVALGDVFCASKMYGLAESEFRRAQRVPCPVDPADNNVTYGLYGDDEDESTAAERVEEARERARRLYATMTVEKLVPIAVERVLDVAKDHGAAEGRKQAKRVAESFPNLARAQYLNAYMDLEFVRGLDATIDRTAFLRRTLTIAERAAQAFPKSAVIASFHARLLFVLGEYDAAERECRRALVMKEPDDPQHDCIPPGSISGENRGARLVSLACEFHELLNRILVLASDYWNSMTSERQQGFLFVRLDVLQGEYNKVDQLRAFTVSDVQSFVKEKGSWRYWVCPICVGNKKFLDTGLLLSHMCSKHPRAVLPRLQSVLDPKLTEKALEGDDSLDGLSFCQDSDQKDMITFDKRSDLFKWLFYAPSSGVGPKPFAEIRETKRHQGNMLLESIKERMKTLPADKSASEFAEALPEIHNLWHNFLRASVMDYRAIILTLARSFLWKELKKCMTEDQKATAKFISAADIDAVFTKEDASIFTKEDDTDGALKITESHEESKVHAADESSETTGNGTQLSGPPVNVTESVDDAVFTKEEASIFTKQDDTDGALKIIESHEESEVHAADESSETAGNDTEQSGPPVNITESVDNLETKAKNLQIDPNSDGSIATSEACSSDQNGQQA
ncbi:hypothetical protein EJB05_27647, partial [Eragrostis curvula]